MSSHIPPGVAPALAGVALALGLLAAGPGRSGTSVTDASIVTAIDISDSVPASDMRAQLAALAAAIRGPDFLAAVGRGRAGRVRLAVFAWHGGQFEILPWTVVGTPAEAEAAARAVEERMAVDVDLEARQAAGSYIGRLTDLSRAIDHAGRLAADAAAGQVAGRVIVNVVGNGADNMGEPAVAARERLLAAGATVNGLVFGGDAAVADYYRSEVAGGAGSFVITASGPDSLVEAMRRKLVMDMVAALDYP